VDLQTTPAAAIPGLLIVRPDEMLFFANVASVRDRVVQAVADTAPPPTVVLLDLGLTPEVDVPVIEALENLDQRLRSDGIELWLCHLLPEARDLLDRAGVVAAIGADRIHPRVLDAIVAFALRSPEGAARVAALNDVLALIDERAARTDLSPDAQELLRVLADRLSLELSASTERAERSAADGGR
jgi:MFS superfamily sulfate permease-like transporter